MYVDWPYKWATYNAWGPTDFNFADGPGGAKAGLVITLQHHCHLSVRLTSCL